LTGTRKITHAYTESKETDDTACPVISIVVLKVKHACIVPIAFNYSGMNQQLFESIPAIKIAIMKITDDFCYKKAIICYHQVGLSPSAKMKGDTDKSVY